MGLMAVRVRLTSIQNRRTVTEDYFGKVQKIMRVGFIGLGNVGAKLADSLLRNGFDLHVRDVDRAGHLGQGRAMGGSESVGRPPSECHLAWMTLRVQ